MTQTIRIKGKEHVVEARCVPGMAPERQDHLPAAILAGESALSTRVKELANPEIHSHSSTAD